MYTSCCPLRELYRWNEVSILHAQFHFHSIAARRAVRRHIFHVCPHPLSTAMAFPDRRTESVCARCPTCLHCKSRFTCFPLQYCRATVLQLPHTRTASTFSHTRPSALMRSQERSQTKLQSKRKSKVRSIAGATYIRYE
jgi:hypothetical protein